jgi:hypothetical protein
MRAGIIQETHPKTSAERDVFRGVRTFEGLFRSLDQSFGYGTQEAANRLETKFRFGEHHGAEERHRKACGLELVDGFVGSMLLQVVVLTSTC